MTDKQHERNKADHRRRLGGFVDRVHRPGIWIANRLIASLARLYERGWISDISLVFLFGMALTAALAGPTARVSLLRPWSPRIRFGSR
jgi:hypothetical protein